MPRKKKIVEAIVTENRELIEAIEIVPLETCLKLSLAYSEVARVEAQIVALDSQLQLTRPQLQPAKQKVAQLETKIKEEYKIGPEDVLDVNTGLITRKK